MYGAQIAEIYDLIHAGRGKDFAAEAAQVAKLIWSRHPRATSLLDVACGTGAHLRCFAELFAGVEGLELSQDMLAIARARAPELMLRHGDMRSFTLARTFSAVTCMFGSIGYLSTPGDLDVTLLRFARHLEPHGVVVIDPWWFAETFHDGYVAGGTAAVNGRTVARVSHSALHDRGAVPVCLMDVHYLVAEAGQGVRHVMEKHRISLFSRAQYETAFRRAGLAVEYLPQVLSPRGLFVGAAC